jgi:hypothetical protein
MSLSCFYDTGPWSAKSTLGANSRLGGEGLPRTFLQVRDQLLARLLALLALD